MLSELPTEPAPVCPGDGVGVGGHCTSRSRHDSGVGKTWGFGARWVSVLVERIGAIGVSPKETGGCAGLFSAGKIRLFRSYPRRKGSGFPRGGKKKRKEKKERIIK